MSNLVRTAGWGQLQRALFQQAPGTATRTIPALSTAPALPPGSQSISSFVPAVINKIGSRSRQPSVTAQDAAVHHTSIRWPRPSAPAVSQLGLRRAHSPRTGEQAGLIGLLVRQTSVQSRRRYSDRVSRAGGRPARGSAETNAEPTGRSPGEDLNKPPPDADHSGKHLSDYLPHIHRPTKEELLAAATGFWNRLGIRFKWFTIRSMRPYKIDDFHAFFTWILWGHVLWIILGTTTFFSLAILAINSIFAQETLAGWVGNYLTQSSGIRVVFESAIVPKWRDGVIEFKNVFVSRRPGSQEGRAVSKGSSETAAAAAAARNALEKAKQDPDGEDDGNYTQFDVNIESVAVTLSFTKWFNGKGLLGDVEVRGVRGVIDRTSVHWGNEPVDPKSYLHVHNPGDFEIDNFRMEDVLLTLYQPKGFRPFTVSVFNCELPRLRKQWLFYDFLCANNMNGSFDESLFTIHPRQVHGYTGAPLNDGVESSGTHSHWKKHSRIRIDGLNIDHLNTGVDGPFGWIHRGNVDFVVDIMIPDDKDGSIAQVVSDFYDQLEATVTSAHHHGWHKQSDNIIRHDNLETTESETTSHLQAGQPPPAPESSSPNEKRFMVMDIHCSLNDVRASVPFLTKDLSYVNNALVRPIVAYINSRRSFIPINCRVVKRLSEFDGSWTIFDCGLLDDLSREVYDAFANDIYDQKQRSRRMKKVGLWTLQVVGQALFLGLAGQLT